MSAYDDLNDLHRFNDNYLCIPFNGFSPSDNNFARDLEKWISFHYCDCKYFNGFSIARQRNNKDSDIILRCSCGDYRSVHPGYWYARVYENDLEDVIEDLNYKCRGNVKLNIVEEIEHQIKVEILRRKLLEEEMARCKHKETKHKNSVNPILNLEI